MELDQLKCLKSIMQRLDAKTSNKDKYDHFQVSKSKLSKFANTKITGMSYTDNILDLLQRGNIINITNEPNNKIDLKINNVKLKKALLLVNGDIYTTFMDHNNNGNFPYIANVNFKYIFDYAPVINLFQESPTLRIIYCLIILSDRNGGNMIFCDYNPNDYWDLWLEINDLIRETFDYPKEDQYFSVDSNDIAKAIKKLKQLGIVNQIAGIITLNRYRLYVYLANVKNILVLNS